MKSSHFYEDVREKRFLSLRDRWTDGRIGCNTLCGAYRDRHITTSRIGNTSKSLPSSKRLTHLKDLPLLKENCQMCRQICLS